MEASYVAKCDFAMGLYGFFFWFARFLAAGYPENDKVMGQWKGTNSND
jgi:hypothetical protein